MVSRNKYVTPIDAIRRIDSSIDQADIGDNFSLPVDEDVLLAHIEGVEDEFERRATELTDQTVSEELAEGVEREFGWTVYLDHTDVKPLDSAKGDKVEIRTGEDSFTDVTDDVFLNPEQGVIEVDQRVFRVTPYYPQQTNHRFRASYRYGGTSGEAGETTTTGSVSASTSPDFTIGVSDAESIPVGSVVLVGGEEYVLVKDRDTGADTLTVGQRALRGTTAIDVESDDDVVFLPMNVRDAVSAKVATRLLRQDDFLDSLAEGVGDDIDNQQKIDDLQSEFEAVIGRYTTNSGYI